MLSEGFIRDFFKMDRKSKGIDQTCPKCGNDMNVMEYDGVFKRIDIKCARCKYRWTVPTLDSVPNPQGEPHG